MYNKILNQSYINKLPRRLILLSHHNVLDGSLSPGNLQHYNNTNPSSSIKRRNLGNFVSSSSHPNAQPIKLTGYMHEHDENMVHTTDCWLRHSQLANNLHQIEHALGAFTLCCCPPKGSKPGHKLRNTCARTGCLSSIKIQKFNHNNQYSSAY